MEVCYNETMKKSNLELDIMLCKKYHYNSIEIRIEYLQDYLKTHDVAELKAVLAANGIRPLAFNSVDDINFCTASQWSYILDRFIFACKMCKELDNPYIVVVPTGNDEMPDKHPFEVFNDCVEVLRTLSGIAAPYGAKLAFEPIGNRRWCVRSIREAAEIIKAVNRDNVGLTLDAMNLYCYTALRDMADLETIPQGKIFVFHINDSMDLPPQELEPELHRLYPGDGIIPLKEFCRMLKNVGYNGPASLELFNPVFFEQAPETVIREGYEKTVAVLSALE